MLDFNLYKPQRIDLIKKMTHSGKDVFVAGALAGAVYDSRLWRFQGMKSIWYWLRAWKNNPQLKSMIKHMKFLNDLPNVSAAQAALAYVLKDENVKSALVGTTKVKHLKELLMATEINLDQSIIRQIESQAQKYLSK